MATTTAQAASSKNKECKMDCSFASPYQLTSAGITDPEDYKENSYGATPTSKYDICACKDGSIAIFRHGECGQIKSLWEVTYERWK